jgi:hypothetical protein
MNPGRTGERQGATGECGMTAAAVAGRAGGTGHVSHAGVGADKSTSNKRINWQ